MHELAKRLRESDLAEAYYCYRVSRRFLTPEIIGPETDMLDFNIRELQRTLPEAILSAEDDLANQFTPLKY
jgi:hypothetical protein